MPSHDEHNEEEVDNDDDLPDSTSYLRTGHYALYDTWTDDGSEAPPALQTNTSSGHSSLPSTRQVTPILSRSEEAVNVDMPDIGDIPNASTLYAPLPDYPQIPCIQYSLYGVFVLHHRNGEY